MDTSWATMPSSGIMTVADWEVAEEEEEEEEGACGIGTSPG